MSTQHTQGRLISWPDRNGRIQVGTSTNYTVAEMCITPLEGQAANARRLVACWNACEGMEDPEAEVAALRKDSDYLMASERLRAKAIEQRDELLAALEADANEMEVAAGVMWSRADGIEHLHKLAAQALRNSAEKMRYRAEHARAAIAKVKGGAA